MKVFTYARVSTDKQATVPDQLRQCRDYARQHGWSVTAEFIDDGISGAALGNRPGLLRALAALKAARGGLLLVVDLSRLSRSQELAPLMDRVRFAGGRVVGVTDGFDSDSAQARLQAGLSGLMSDEMRAGIRARTHGALKIRAEDRRATGGKAYGYVSQGGTRTIDATQAKVVRLIFQRYAEGASPRTIATELNAQRVPSPGSSWKRVKRRAGGWMANCIRGILANPVYTGHIVWNTNVWVKDPDSGRRVRRARPRSEWIEHDDEALRIIDDALWKRAQRRTRFSTNSDKRLKAGGKARFMLSGLMVCEKCGANYVLANRHGYRCSSFVEGGGCDNGVQANRKHVEDVLLKPVYDGLLVAPDRVKRIVQKMQADNATHLRQATQRREEIPAEAQVLDKRLARLRSRLKAGDPDMEPAEIMAVIEQVQAKRAELVTAQPEAAETAKVLALLPKAAELYEQEIREGLAGDPVKACRGRTILRELLGGPITMRPGTDGSLRAFYFQNPEALLLRAGQVGSGGRI